MEIRFGLHYQENLSENPWCAVIGLSLPLVAPRKWIFSHIFLLVTPKSDFQLVFIRKYSSMFFTYKPSPDWKGPRKRVAVRQWSGKGPAEPWKAGKNIYLHNGVALCTVKQRNMLQKIQKNSKMKSKLALLAI